ncbi:MAG TPA: aspartate aminotransferase family protein [Edaphocola sp.]|nr:aspartate aminotransferase family protein [Edaphocola sp.]
MNQRQLFQKHLAPTSPEPMCLPISYAEGCILKDENGKEYIDLIGGISVCNVGHRHPKVVEAIKNQADTYLHVMVYGEVIQSPMVQFASLLAQHLPETLSCTYFTNSGAEAVEGAMKLAKRATGRSKIIACHNSYHGSTQGAWSLIGSEDFRINYRPLLPEIYHVSFNSQEAINQIDEDTACIIMETVQAEAGIITPNKEWIKAIREKCNQTGTLLILDEIQVGFGRTGTLWGFQQYDIIPDVLLLGKALGGGMPLGAFIASKELMQTLSINPILGHMTTFGGHPVCCAAGKAAMEALLNEEMLKDVETKGKLFVKKLQDHPHIKTIRQTGLMIALELENFEKVQQSIKKLLEQGIFTDWFLFASNCLRIVPPLNISEKTISEACEKIKTALNS